MFLQRGSTGDEPETTNEDLAGFWDMVMIQVEQVYSLFADLKKKQVCIRIKILYGTISCRHSIIFIFIFEFKSPESAPVTPLKTSSPKRVPVSTSKSSTRPTAGATPKVNSAAAKAR